MMRRYASLAAIAALVMGLSACSQDVAGPSASDYQKQRAEILDKHKRQAAASQTAQTAEVPDESGDGGTMAGNLDGFFYDPVGKRDPFRSFIQDNRALEEGIESPLEGFDLGQLEVAGVVWRGDRRRALILDPSGQAYVVSEGDVIGKNSGRILAINDASMLVKEKYVDFHGEQTEKEIEMRIRQSQGG